MIALFWDIDGTLLTTARAGVFSLEAALEEVSGVRTSLQGMATAGMTDYSIAEAALARVGHATDEETVQRFLSIHGEQLAGFLHKREGEVLPGVREVLEDLDGRDGGLQRVVQLLPHDVRQRRQAEREASHHG